MLTSSSPVARETVTTLAGLEALRLEWERLFGQSPRATPFQSPQWLLPWWKHVGRGELATLAMRCAHTGELVALAPLYVWSDASSGRRTLFPIGIATSDYLDVLVRPGWEASALRCLGWWLAEHAREWDKFEFPQLRRDAALLAFEPPSGWRHEFTPGEPSPVLALCDVSTGAASAVPSAMARNVRYCRRRAERAGRIDYATADAQTVAAFLDALVRLHASRWSERGRTGVLSDTSVLAWHREAVPALQAAGLLRMHALLHAGEFIAVLFCLADPAQAADRCCYDYLGGFDPRLRALSPGTLLVAYAIDQAVSERATAFDFLRGAEAYKYRWGAVDRPTQVLRLCPERAVAGGDASMNARTGAP
jgi:CelD/BcsL family acetyltransferase involved in cellulose biosynthesis